MSDKRILIVGGGFAGIYAAVGAAETLRAASDETVSVELVSPDPYLVIKPRLYETDLAGVRVPLAGVLDPIGVSYRQGRVETIDTAAKTVALDDGTGPLPYDQLVFAAGSQMPLPAGADVHAADSYEQAVALRAAVSRLAAGSSVVVVGAGFTGVELAAELGGGSTRVTLVERDPHLSPEFGPRARAVIEEALSSLGVTVRSGAGVAAVDRGGVALEDGLRVDGDLVVWAAGPKASPLTEQIPATRDRLGRLDVDRFLSTGVDGVWAAGDSAAACVGGEQSSVMSCQHASPQGRLAGENAAAAVVGRAPGAYRQSLYLTCLDLGAYGAVVTCGFDRDTILASGPNAKSLKRFINRSLIYPPADADAKQILKLGRPAPPGPAGAAIVRTALRSGAIRRMVTGNAQDRAALFAAQ